MAKAIFNGNVERVDEVLSAISTFLVNGNPDGDVPYVEKLNRDKLDYSVSSLKYVDEYLKIVRRKNLNDHQTSLIVLRCGAYCGEVIKNNTHGLEWIAYEQEVLLENIMGQWKIKKDPIYSYFLYGSHSKSLIQPLQKVIKFIENGEEDSLEFFAKAMIGHHGFFNFLRSCLRNPFPQKIPVVELKPPKK